jgi:hypothetical protein
MADGCFLHEATIGILQNTEATVRAAISALSNAETQTGLTTLTNGRLISVDSFLEPSASSTRLSFWKKGMCGGPKERGHSCPPCR